MRFFGLAILLFVAACGEVVTVQPGEVGKQLNARGLQDGVIDPGTVRLDSCWGSSICPRIVRMESGRVSTDLAIDSVFLPKSNVDVSNVRVGIQYRVRPDQRAIDRVFSEVRPDDKLFVSARRVWETYGQRVVPSVIVDVLKDLQVEQVMNTGSELSDLVHKAVNEALRGMPIEVTQLAVVDTDVPGAVMDSKRRLFSIEDDRARQLKQLEVGVAVEQRRQAFQTLRAESDLKSAAVIGIPVAQYVCLRVAEKMADAADEKGAVAYFAGDCGLSQPGAARPLPVSSKAE